MTKMPAHLRVLYIDGLKTTGNLQEAASYHEEELTLVELKQLLLFAGWLQDHSLTVGHGTIDLRWNEFVNNKTPLSQEEMRKLISKEGV